MKNVARGLLIGSLCVGMLAGCSNPTLRSTLTETMGSVGTATSTDLLDKGVASAKSGDTTTAVGYFTSWYALQSDKAAAKNQLLTLGRQHVNDAAGKAVNTALSKL